MRDHKEIRKYFELTDDRHKIQSLWDVGKKPWAESNLEL